MKRLYVLIGMLCCLAAAAPAMADRDGGGGGYDPSERRADDWRDRGHEERRQDVERRSRRDSLSPEERRQLRRDIKDYGRDVYRERGERRR